MGSYTTIKLYKRVIDFLYATGISPLQLLPNNKDNSIIVDQKVINSEISEEVSVSSCDQRFEFFEVCSWRKAKALFWLVWLFAICSITFFVTKLILLIKDPESEISYIIGSFCWCSYIWSCIFIYLTHLLKSKAICDFVMDWQKVEGEILTDSKAVDFLRQRKEQNFWNDKYQVPSFFIRSQTLRMRLFQITIPVSIALMGLNIAFSPRYPMYFSSLLPPNTDVVSLKVVCFILTWAEVFFFAFCENQIELLFIAFACNVSNCLKLLTMPAEIWTECESLKFQSSTTKPFLLLANNFLDMDAQILNIMEDSVQKYENLNRLLKTFNKIWAWPTFTFKAITLFRLCCYVYVILRFPQDNGFLSIIVFHYAVVAIFFKFGLFLSSMGAVYTQTLVFLKSWKKLLLLLNQNTVLHERRLKSCSKFGFLCGHFYTVHPSTILTFYSVTLTYLIIFLQLGTNDDIKKENYPTGAVNITSLDL